MPRSRHAQAMLILFLVTRMCGVKCATVPGFAEHLKVYRLRPNEAYLDFRFEMSIRSQHLHDLRTQLHFFPIALSEIAFNYNTKYVHAALTNRVWMSTLASNFSTGNVDRFSAEDVIRQASPGATIYAALDDVGSVQNLSHLASTPNAAVSRRWKLLTNALSSLLCASFNFVKDDNTVIPHADADITFLRHEKSVTLSKRHALLPRESVCTENLTPFFKLLPCQAKAGLAALLNSATLAAVPYLTVSLDLWQQNISSEDPNHSVNVVLSLATVVRSPAAASVLYKLQNERIDNGDHLMQQLGELFSTQSTSGPKFHACPLASASIVQVYETNGEIVKEFRSGADSATLLPLHAVHLKPHHMTVSTYFSGYDQYSGAFHILLENRGASPQLVLVSQLLPWFVLTFFHLLRIETTNQSSGVKSVLTPMHRHIMPSIMRSRPNYFEYQLELPSDSVTKLSIDVEYALMRWNEYPPDASRGLDVPACAVKLLNRLENVFQNNYSSLLFGAAAPTLSTTTIYSNSLLVLLPTPDFSMPYNVICLTCTVVALAVGPFQQMTTKRAYVEKMPKKKPKTATAKEEKVVLEANIVDAAEEDAVDPTPLAECLEQTLLDREGTTAAT